MNDSLEAKNFTDFRLIELNIEYNCVTISLTNDSGSEHKIICKGFTAIEYIGQWDESIIKSIEVYENTAFINRTLKCVKTKNESLYIEGNDRNKDTKWLEVNVTLIDKVSIKIVCSDVHYKKY